MKLSYFFFGIIFVLATSCQSGVDEDLKQANDSLAKMTTKRNLAKSCFSVVYPQGDVANFVNYLFSDLGAAEWPIAFDEMEAEQIESIGQTPLPRNVVVSPLKRNQLNSKEIVLAPDLENQVVVVKGYLPGSQEVVWENQWSLGTAQASEDTQQLCQSNLETGISPYYQE